MTRNLKLAIFTSILLINIAAGGLYNWLSNRPVYVGNDAPEGKLGSLSFAPFREGEDPLQKHKPNPKNIAEDLQLLADKTHSIRTYSSVNGMEVIPDLVRQNGLTLTQGAWLNYDEDVDPATLEGSARDKLLEAKQSNALEIAALIESANANTDVVKRVIVGNEVLLRGDMPSDLLVKYIRQVKQAIKQPVSYADVWSFYLKHPEVAKEVDFITIHILPYWEDEPLEVNAAIDHIEKIYQQVHAQVSAMYPGKPILIGESGWPSHGRQRGWAVPSVVNEARFVRGLIQVANKNGFDLNIVEAFDQPWKSALEGVVGANWGLFTANRKPVFPLTGPVVENSSWYFNWSVSSALLVILAACFYKTLLNLSIKRMVFLTFVMAVLSYLWVALTVDLWQTSYNGLEKMYTLGVIFLSAILLVLLLRRCLDVLTERATKTWISMALRYLYGLTVFLMIYKTSALAINGRYLSFPNAETSIAVAGILALALAHVFFRNLRSTHHLDFNKLVGNTCIDRRLDKRVGLALLLLGISLIAGETYAFVASRDFIQDRPDLLSRLWLSLRYTLENCQLDIWLFSLAVIAVPFRCSGRQPGLHACEPKNS